MPDGRFGIRIRALTVSAAKMADGEQCQLNFAPLAGWQGCEVENSMKSTVAVS
jgi:hypothetical protein